MKRQLWSVFLLGSMLVTVHGQGSVFLENYDLDVVVRTQFPNSVLNGPFTVSLWYLPGATSVPANLSTITYDGYGNQIAGGVLGLLNDGYQQVSPSYRVTAEDGQFYGGTVQVPGATPGGNAVLAVVGWLSTATNIHQILLTDQVGVISFVNPVPGDSSYPPEVLTGWLDTRRDLVLQYVPFPEPSSLSICGLGFASFCLARRKRTRRCLV